jgi:hypothetical protein
MADTRTITGMRSRMIQLQRIANMTHSQEISDLVLRVADEIQAEINRLEAEQPDQDPSMPMPPQG